MRAMTLAIGFGVALAGLSVQAAWADAPGAKFDGTYVGRQTRTSGRGCGYSGDVKMQVKDGGFTWRQNNIASTVTIAGSGEIAGASGSMHQTGKADAKGLDFESISPSCQNQWHFDRQ